MFKERWDKSVWWYHVNKGLQPSKIKNKSTRKNEEFLSRRNSSVTSKILLGVEKKKEDRNLSLIQKNTIT